MRFWLLISLIVTCFTLKGIHGQQSCGRSITVPVGSEDTISSPGYPAAYPSDSSCTYRIMSSPSSNHVTIRFNSFHVESHRKCSFDYLAVHDGPSTSSRLIKKFCGSELPPTITSSGSSLTIYFHSDSSVQGDGFEFSYSVGCTYTYTETHGQFSSPGYPSDYPQNSDCTYNIQPASGNQVLLSFLYLEIEESSSCSYDRLALFTDATAPEIYRFCGRMNPFNVLVSASKFTLKFHSDRSVSRPGFRLSYNITRDCDHGNGGCAHDCQNISPGSVECSCRSGYELTYGSNCVDNNECSSENPCQDVCTNTDGSFSCSCSKLGFLLSPDGRNCTDMSCKKSNGGCEHTCLPAGNAHYFCGCHHGYVLAPDAHNCTDINECTTNDAALVHKCEHHCVNEAGSYFCTCNSGYVVSSNGRTCEDVDECPNHEDTCDHQCKNVPGGWECSCYSGFKVDPENPHMCVDVDECAEDLAPVACTTCWNSEGSYQCLCSDGFNPNDDNTDCIDVNECMDRNGGCDQVCLNTPGSMKCACFSGYEPPSNNSVSCNDINECAPNNGQGPCDHFCENLDGSFRCLCIGGYSLLESGLECQDINECEHIANCQQQCVNQPGSYFCKCFEGYHEINGTCTDIDECLTTPCDALATCNNTIGSFTCSCPTGYLVENVTVCSDVNECSMDQNKHGCSQECVNNPGSYTCECRIGYSKIGDKGCIDINECQNDPCQHNCENTIGSFVCSCRQGYYLIGDGIQCSDVDECTDQLHTCAQVCVNEIGRHSCACNVGYLLNADNATCSDIDECESGAGGCSDGCINSVGSYWCYCANGFQLDSDNKTCIDTNECLNNNGNCQHICTNNNGSYTCGCESGFQFNGTHGCSDIDECATSNGMCSQQCVNQPGSYVCQCEPNFKLSTDNHTCEHCPTCEQFETLASDVGNLKSNVSVVAQLTNSNMRLSAKVAQLESRITQLELTINGGERRPPVPSHP
ncbi:uncharacterized protein LOC100178017 [Ciona intestinalis]